VDAVRIDSTEQRQKVVIEPISAEFPYEPRYAEVLGHRMHYVEAGEGDPILLLHGEPTWSYLWRNVIPFLARQGRVIAVDNIGFGKSDKPHIAYTYTDHIQHIEGFIAALGLRRITLVVHDWGSALGLDYAARHEDNVLGVALMEAMIAPMYPISTDDPALPLLNASFPNTARDPILGPKLLMEQNAFIEEYLPGLVVRDLTEAEMDAYRAPFRDPASRFPILSWPRQVPIDGEPRDSFVAISNYNAWLERTRVPRLHLYAKPGSLNPPELVAALAARCRAYETAYIGPGLHYVQEDQPEAIGRAVADWRRRLVEA
jgi:haloalkane dehalogenase